MASPITADETDANIDWVASRPGAGCPSPFRQDVGNPIDDGVMPNTSVQTAAGIDPIAWKRLIVQALEFTSVTPPAGTEDAAYTHTFTAQGGSTPYAWSVSVGTLPAGITLNATTGVLAGTPTVAGTTNFTVKVTDSKGAQSATRAVALVVAPA
jgi:hypothetical protein